MGNYFVCVIPVGNISVQLQGKAPKIWRMLHGILPVKGFMWRLEAKQGPNKAGFYTTGENLSEKPLSHSVSLVYLSPNLAKTCT